MQVGAVIKKHCQDRTKELVTIGQSESPPPGWCQEPPSGFPVEEATDAIMPDILERTFKQMDAKIWSPLKDKVDSVINKIAGSVMQLIDGLGGLSVPPTPP